MPARTASVPLLAAALAASACSSAPALPRQPDGAAVLEVRGDIEGDARSLGSRDLAHLQQRTVRGTDPATGRTASWSGVDLHALVERVRKKPGVDTLVVRTADGAAAPMSLSVVRQLRPVLAAVADGEPLTSPVVAWPTQDQPGLQRDPRLAGWWAVKPIALELVRWPRAFGARLAAPAGSPEGARPGSGLFVQRCVVCHTVRGAGGSRGPELTAWASSHDEAALNARLGKHPGRTVDDPDSDIVPPLYAYLSSIAKAPPFVEEGPGEKPPGERGEHEKQHGGMPPPGGH